MEETKVFPEFKFKGKPLDKENAMRFMSLLMSKSKEVPLDQTDKEMLELPCSGFSQADSSLQAPIYCH